MLDNLKKIFLPTKDEIKKDIPILLAEGSAVIKSLLNFVKRVRDGGRFVK